ncbi:hypothetical protein LTR08_006531 [Meristemomyces frigidus]|nr:hypothetical protein LTR08_006531 [Meristemomyces frigidus]
MKYLFSAAALLAATVVAEKRDLCSDGTVDDGGNWYCQKVDAITYTGVGGTGSYNKITGMFTENSGYCTSAAQGYSGSMSPLDEEVSMHIRGPIQLKQFAVYTPSSASKKRSAHARRHAHGHVHQHHARDAAVGDLVVATINGVVESWTNEYSGEASTSAPASSATEAPATYSAAVSVIQNNVVASSSSAAAASSTLDSSSDSTTSSSGGWSRTAYYDSESGTKDGLVFLNHNGGSGSGSFDYTFGNSLSYASADGCSGVSEPTTLEDTTLPSSEEIVIMSDTKCDGDDCGFVRNDTVAYHGFDGSSKAFFFEFQMPDSGETSTSEYDPVNMPAVWMLNAQIPRTLQYGNADCSCWESGCGEFDIFEVLAAGDTRMKSTLHGNIAGGDSDYFARPTGSPQKAVMLLNNNNIHIKLLDSSTDFGSTMDMDFINDLCSSTLTQSLTTSLFALVD